MRVLDSSLLSTPVGNRGNDPVNHPFLPLALHLCAFRCRFLARAAADMPGCSTVASMAGKAAPPSRSYFAHPTD